MFEGNEPIRVTPKQAARILASALPHRGGVWLQGPPGCGKTSMVYNAVQQVAATHNITTKVIYRTPAIEESIDARGALWFDGDAADFRPIGEMQLIFDDGSPACADLIVVFLDDFGQAPKAVQAGYMPFILDNRDGNRVVHGRPIRPEVVFTVATNRKVDKSGVNGVLEAVKGRSDTIVELYPDPDEWVEWALGDGMPISVVAWIKWHREMLLVEKPTTDLQKHANPRNVASLGYIVRDWQVHEDDKLAVYAGAVGEAEAQDYLAFEQVMSQLPDIDMILLDPANAVVPSEPGALWATVGSLAQVADPTNIDAVATYLGRIDDAEFTVFGMLAAAKAAPAITSTAPFQQWLVANKDLYKVA